MVNIRFILTFLIVASQKVSAKEPLPHYNSNEERVYRKVHFLASFETTLPVYYINANSSNNERLMLEYLLTDVPSAIKGNPSLQITRVSALHPSDKADTVTAYIDQRCTGGADATFHRRERKCLPVLAGLVGHLDAIQQAYENGDPAALILEDRAMAVLPHLWSLSLDDAVKLLDARAKSNQLASWDILRLHLSPPEEHTHAFINSWKADRRETIWFTPVELKECCGTLAYIISRTGMAKVLSYHNGGDGKFSCSRVRLFDQSFLKNVTDLLYGREEAGCRSLEELLYTPLFFQFVSIPQRFSFNIIAANRTVHAVLKTPQGRAQYKQYVLAVQQNMEQYMTRIPSPVNVDDVLPQYDHIWDVQF